MPGLIRIPLHPPLGFFLCWGPRGPSVQLQARNCESGRPGKASPGGGSWAGIMQQNRSPPLTPLGRDSGHISRVSGPPFPFSPRLECSEAL